MADYEGMRAALWRNIEGLTHLTDDQKAALLDTQMAQCIAATEAGRPFVEIYGPPAAEEDSDGAEEPPARSSKPQSKIRHAGIV